MYTIQIHLMLCRKGQKKYIGVHQNTISSYVERVERNTLEYIRIQLVFMSKGLKEIQQSTLEYNQFLCQKGQKKYIRMQLVVMLCVLKESKLGTYIFLLITFLIFNQFSIPKRLGKLRLRTFQTYHQILCMLKHVKGVKSYLDLQPLQHASTYIIFDEMVGKLSKTFFWIENW